MSCNCPSGGGPPIIPGQASIELRHDNKAGTKREYSFERTSGFDAPSGPTTSKQTVTVTYVADGKAEVTVDGTAAGTFAVSNTGDFDLTAADGEVPPALHLLVIGDSPPPATTKVGDKWEVIEPADSEVDANALNVQTRLSYEVVAVDPGKSVDVDVVGDLRFVDTPGGRDFIKQLFPTAQAPGSGTTDSSTLMADLVASYTVFRPYLQYRATFDLVKGGIQGYSGKAVFNITGRLTLDQIASDPRRHEFELKGK